MKIYKRTVSLLLCIAMCLCLATPALAANESNSLGVTFSAALDNNILSVSTEAQSVTMTIQASESVKLSAMDMYVTGANRDGTVVLPVESVTNETLGLTTTGNFTPNTGRISWYSISGVDISDVTDLAKVTFTIPENTPAGTYVLSATGIQLSDTFGSNTWEDGASVSATLTVTEPTVEGYSVDLSTTSSNNEVVSEGTVTVNVNVSHSADTIFNAGEIKLSYDGSVLNPDTEYIKDTLNLNYSITDGEDGKSVLTIEDFGGDKNLPYTYGIPFTASRVSEEATSTVTLTSAAFVHKDNADKNNLIAAVNVPVSLNVTIKVATVTVTLTNSSDNSSTSVVIEKGKNYTFSPADTGNYTYSNVIATVDGKLVNVTTSPDGKSFTIAGEDVTGNIAITYTKTANSYDVTVEGDDRGKITLPDGTPTYGVDYTFIIPENQEPTAVSDGYTYTVTVTVNGEDYSPTVNGLEYTITGTDIIGDVVITIETFTHPSTGLPQVTVNINGSTDVKVNGGNSATVDQGSEVTLTLMSEAGYIYSVVVGSGDPVTFTNTEYKFYANESVTVTVTKTLDVSTVAVYEYVTMDTVGSAWLVTFDGTLASGKVPTYDNNVMYWSAKYDAYCWLVVARTLNADEAKTKVNAQTATAPTVEYGMDINGTGITDAADAQLVWNMYNAMYNSFNETDEAVNGVAMAKFLAADQNAVSTNTDTWKLTVEDARVIIAAILPSDAT